MSPADRVAALLDTIEAQIQQASATIVDSYLPEDGCDPGTLLRGLHTLRCAVLSLGELREAIGAPDGNGSEVADLAAALASKARPQ